MTHPNSYNGILCDNWLCRSKLYLNEYVTVIMPQPDRILRYCSMICATQGFEYDVKRTVDKMMADTAEKNRQRGR